MIKIEKLENWYNPWATSKGYLKQIVVFNDRESVTLNQGWIDSARDGLEFEELPYKLKVDNTRKFSYLAKSPNWNNEQVLTLFIYAPELKTEVFDKKYSYHGERNFYKKCEFENAGRPVTFEVFDHEEETEESKAAEHLAERIKELTYYNIDKFHCYELLKHFKIEEI